MDGRRTTAKEPSQLTAVLISHLLLHQACLSLGFLREQRALMFAQQGGPVVKQLIQTRRAFGPLSMGPIANPPWVS